LPNTDSDSPDPTSTGPAPHDKKGKGKGNGRSKKQKVDEPKVLTYSHRDEMELLQIPKMTLPDKEYCKRSQEGSNLPKDIRNQLHRLVPPEVFDASLRQDEVEVVNLQANSRLFSPAK
jgi:hypothetical protein